MRFCITILAILLAGCSEPESAVVLEDEASTLTDVSALKVEKITASSSKYPNLEIIITNQASESYKNKYLKASFNKAFAQSKSGACAWRSNRTSEEHAKESALIACQINNKKNESLSPCKIINVNEKWLTDS